MEKQGAWWDKLGKPQYGGEMVIRANWNIVNFDPYNAPLGNIHVGLDGNTGIGRLDIGPGSIRLQSPLASFAISKGRPGGKLGVYRTKHLCCPFAQGNSLAGHTAGKRPGVHR